MCACVRVILAYLLSISIQSSEMEDVKVRGGESEREREIIGHLPPNKERRALDSARR